VLTVLTALLAARLLLLLAICGAFVLAVLAHSDASLVGLWVLIAYCCLTVIPMTALDLKRGVGAR